MSKDYFISDVHIQRPDDEAAKLFIKFLNKCLENKAERTFLLGDIFDLMVGPYTEYEKKYKVIFDSLELLSKSGCQIYYFEGNHDFHLKSFFSEFAQKRELPRSIEYVKDALLIESSGGLTVHLSHGDEMEIDNRSYKIYKRLINNRFVELVAEQLLSFEFVEKIGQKASESSRRRNLQYSSLSSEQDFVRDKFRTSAELLAQEIGVDLIIAGHSHCKDDYLTPTGTRYLNNGYALQSKTCLCLDEAGPRFVKL